LELIDQARRKLLVASPFLDSYAVDFLADAIVAAGRRGAETRLVTSLGQAHHFDAISRRWEAEATASLRVTEVQTHLSSLGSHAKVLVVDDERGYVGSANLTAAGLGRHIEIGVELVGPQVAELATVLAALERVGRPAATVGAAARRD
jgi:phosphatidylserine/phosphatidylglycerophosphate/cardiolipin synthase-like enzyme